MSRLTQQEAKAERAAEVFNQRYPLGTSVRYWDFRKDIGNVGRARETRTTSTAVVMGGHTAVVRLQGITGFVSIEHLRPIDEGKP